MRSVLLFVFLKFALVRCDQVVQKSVVIRAIAIPPCEGTGENNIALQNLMAFGTAIAKLVDISGICKKLYDDTGIGTAETGIRYDYSRGTCYVMGKLDLVVSVRSKPSEPATSPDFEPCRALPAFQATYLHQRESANTYMILDPSRAPWFFTAPLSGCDIFVATSSGERNKPIVIHSNLNTCGNKFQNLKQKGEKIDKILKAHGGYKLVARVYSKPAEEEMHQAKIYLQNYQTRHPGIVLKFYDLKEPATAQFFQFLGHYRESQRNWRFILKGEINGNTQEVLQTKNVK